MAREKVKVVTPFSLVTLIFSLCCSRMVLTMYSPRPTPSLSSLRDLSLLWNRSNSSGSYSAGMVSPRFRTVTRA